MKTAWDQMRTAKEEQYFDKENKKALSRLAEQLEATRTSEKDESPPTKRGAMLHPACEKNT